MKKGICLLVFIVIVVTICGCSKTFNKNEYKKKDIENMFASSEFYDLDEINSDNITIFNELLSYTDKIVGKNQYKIDSIYPVTMGQETAYVIYIVPNEYLDDYNNFSGPIYDNPYRIQFYRNSNGEFGNYLSQP